VIGIGSVREDIIISTIRDQMLLRETWMKKSMVSLLILFHLLLNGNTPGNLSFPMALMLKLSMAQLSIKRSTKRSITRETLVKEAMMRKFSNSSRSIFLLSIQESEATFLSCQMDLIQGPTMELTKLVSVKSTILISTIRDQMLLRETWMKRFMASSLILFLLSLSGSTPDSHSSQMALMLKLSMELLSIKESTIRSTTRRISLREEWTKRFMVSYGKLFHLLTQEKEAAIHSFQMALMLKLSMVLPSTKGNIITRNIRDQMLPREEWMRRSTDSSLILSHH